MGMYCTVYSTVQVEALCQRFRAIELASTGQKHKRVILNEARPVPRSPKRSRRRFH